jgi:hypothetical protein
VSQLIFMDFKILASCKELDIWGSIWSFENLQIWIHWKVKLQPLNSLKFRLSIIFAEVFSQNEVRDDEIAKLDWTCIRIRKC